MTASVTNPTLRHVLEPWCAAGATGALRVLDAPGGTIYLADGELAYAECPFVCGVDRLLTASGRLTPEQWRSALAAGRAGRRVGQVLVDEGLLTTVELETVQLLALHDAAYFLLDTAGETRFEVGAAPVVGTAGTESLDGVCREVDRRRRVLDDAWPDHAIDTAAVLPARRLRGQHVALTALQWEIIANADRRRSPVDLARLLGRDTFATLLEVRRLARAGLVEQGRPGGSATAESMATARARRQTATGKSPDGAAPERPPPDGAVPEREPPPAPPRTSASPAPPAANLDRFPGPAVLPRRERSAPTWSGVTATSGAQLDAADASGCSDSALLRIREALEALR